MSMRLVARSSPMRLAEPDAKYMARRTGQTPAAWAYPHVSIPAAATWESEARHRTVTAALRAPLLLSAPVVHPSRLPSQRAPRAPLRDRHPRRAVAARHLSSAPAHRR